MQPTYRPVRAGGAGFSIFLVCFALAAALTLGAWVYWKRSLKANVAQPVSAAERAAAAAKTNNNPIARAANTLRKVDAANKEGEAEADNMQQKAADATVASAVASPSSSVGAASGGPKLQGIFYNANNPQALINGKSMKVGEEANGVKVLEITKSSVRVQNGSEVRELTMK
jgi:sRNA-binding protein